jgi:hypothetical protein
MLKEALQRPEAERRSVQRFLEAVIRYAEQDADRVAAFLKMQGIKPSRPSKKQPAPSDDVPTGPAANMLLNLAAALRLRIWELAGIAALLPADLPTSADALRAAGAAVAERVGTNQIPMAVFKAWHLHVSRESQTTIGADVVLPARIDKDELLECLADLLYSHRHLMDE